MKNVSKVRKIKRGLKQGKLKMIENKYAAKSTYTIIDSNKNVLYKITQDGLNQVQSIKNG